MKPTIKLKFSWRGYEPLEIQDEVLGRAYHKEAEKITGEDRIPRIMNTAVAVSRGFPIDDPTMIPFAEAFRALNAFKKMCVETHHLDISLVNLAACPPGYAFDEERALRLDNFTKSKKRAITNNMRNHNFYLKKKMRQHDIEMQNAKEETIELTVTVSTAQLLDGSIDLEEIRRELYALGEAERERIRVLEEQEAKRAAWIEKRNRQLAEQAAREEAERLAAEAILDARRKAFPAYCYERITAFLQGKRLLNDHTLHLFHIYAVEVTVTCNEWSHDGDHEEEAEGYGAVVDGKLLSRADYELLAAIQYGLCDVVDQDDGTEFDLSKYLRQRARSLPSAGQTFDPCTSYIDVML